MSASDAGPIERIERAGNEVEVPMTERLGMVDFLKQTWKEARADHLAACVGNLTSHLSPEASRKLWSDNAHRFYRLESR